MSQKQSQQYLNYDLQLVTRREGSTVTCRGQSEKASPSSPLLPLGAPDIEDPQAAFGNLGTLCAPSECPSPHSPAGEHICPSADSGTEAWGSAEAGLGGDPRPVTCNSRLVT